jgi:hypothetical protein
VVAAGVEALDDVVELDVVAGVAGVDAEELLLLDELPQPASTTTPASRARIEALDVMRVRAFVRGAA